MQSSVLSRFTISTYAIPLGVIYIKKYLLSIKEESLKCGEGGMNKSRLVSRRLTTWLPEMLTIYEKQAGARRATCLWPRRAGLGGTHPGLGRVGWAGAQ